jgi:hypothetical protein
MTTPKAKLEYRIERDGEKFVAIDSEEETVCAGPFVNSGCYFIDYFSQSKKFLTL